MTQHFFRGSDKNLRGKRPIISGLYHSNTKDIILQIYQALKMQPGLARAMARCDVDFYLYHLSMKSGAFKMTWVSCGISQLLSVDFGVSKKWSEILRKIDSALVWFLNQYLYHAEF